MGRSEQRTTRRTVLGSLAAAAALPLAGCGDGGWYGTDVTGVLPDLQFRMTRAGDGALVTEETYRGQAVALFFGYTSCPDVCPMTLANLSSVADALGPRAQRLSILFVTVDPERDTRDSLSAYVSAFSDRADALRGTDDALERLTRRLRVTYRVAPHGPQDRNYAVSHGKSVYVFDGAGGARLLWTSFDTADAEIAAAARDLRRIIRGG